MAGQTIQILLADCAYMLNLWSVLYLTLDISLEVNFSWLVSDPYPFGWQNNHFSRDKMEQWRVMRHLWGSGESSGRALKGAKGAVHALHFWRENSCWECRHFKHLMNYSPPWWQGSNRKHPFVTSSDQRDKLAPIFASNRDARWTKNLHQFLPFCIWCSIWESHILTKYPQEIIIGW